MKSNWTYYSSCLQRVRRATRLVSDNCCARRRLTQLSWRSDKLFCVPSISECQFHMGSQNSFGAFLDCLPDWAQGLRHFQCSRWHTQNSVCRCPVADQSYPLFGSSLTEILQNVDTFTFWALFMSLSGRYLNWKNLCVNKILFNVVYSHNNMLLAAKFVIFCVLWFPKVR